MKDLLLKGEFGKDITLDGVKQSLPDELEGGLNVVIDSVGGNLFEAIKITDYLKSLNVPLRATAIKVASAATWPFFQIEDRTIDFTQAKEDWLFIHEARLKPADLPEGVTLTADELRAVADRIDEFNQMLVNLYAQSLGISKSKAAKLMSDETWINQTQAEELNIVAIITNQTDMNLLQSLNAKLDTALSKLGIVAQEVEISVEPKEEETDPAETADPAEDFEAKYKEAMKMVEALTAECEGYKAKLAEKEKMVEEQDTAIKAIEARIEAIKIADLAGTNALPTAKQAAEAPLAVWQRVAKAHGLINKN